MVNSFRGCENELNIPRDPSLCYIGSLASADTRTLKRALYGERAIAL